MVRIPTSLSRRNSTPRKPVSGTGYSANPAIPAPKESFTETGSQRLSAVRDPVPQLATRQEELKTYKAMMRSDVSVRSAMRAGKASVLGAEFYIDAFDESDEAQVIREFCDFSIFYASSIPWTKTLEGVLRFLNNGFSVFEEVWELREWAPKKTSPAANLRQYTVLKKLAERPASTISDFIYDDNGGIQAVKQNALNAQNQATEVTMPIDKLIIFTFEGDGNIEGESILRSAYRNWFYKDKLYTIDAIQKERHGIGVPDIEIQPGATNKERKIAEELGANLRANEKSFIVRTPMLKVGFAELSGNPVDALESAIHHDNQIMKNILVQFINAGLESGGGGRATSATAFDMFMKAMRYIANMICDYFNLYLMPKLVAYNFQTSKMPKMRVRNIGEVKDFQMWAAGIRSLFESNGITPDMPTEQFLRNVADMPEKTEPRPEFAETSTTRQNVLLQGQVEGKNAPKKSTSKNQGAGNVPKSPSSGAVEMDDWKEELLALLDRRPSAD